MVLSEISLLYFVDVGYYELKYTRTKGGGKYAGFVFEESKLVLYFSEARYNTP